MTKSFVWSVRGMLFASLWAGADRAFSGLSDIGALDRNASPVVVSGVLDTSDASDTVRFDLESRCQVDLLLDGLSGNADLKLLDASGQVLATSAKKNKKAESIKKTLPTGEYRLVVHAMDAQPVSYTLQASAQFVVDDVIASGKVTVQDPEYDAASLKVAWRDGTTLLATSINPHTGLFDMDNRVVVDTGLATVEEVINGPEWTSILGGQPRVIYTKSSGNAWSISQAQEQLDGTWQTDNFFLTALNWWANPVPGTQNGYKPIGSQDGDDAAPLMKFTIGTKENRDQANAWKELDPPFDGGQLPAGAQAGRFVPGLFAIIYSRLSGGFQQLIWWDLRNREETILTNTPIHKILPFAINAPEFGGEVLITAPETDNIDERGFFDSIGVYREVDGVWTLIKRIASPSPTLRGVHSAEPFVFDGRSYVSFLVLKAVSREEERKDDAEVWIASLDPEDRLLRKVCGDAHIKRSDPESLVTENEVFIYYTEIAKKTHRQHRTRTGLIKRKGRRTLCLRADCASRAGDDPCLYSSSLTFLSVENEIEEE